MRILGLALVCLCLAGLASCSAGLPRRPAGEGPFSAPGPNPPACDLEEIALVAAGMGLGILAAWIWFRIREPAPMEDACRPKEAMAILQDALSSQQARKKLVRIRDWLGRRRQDH